MPGGIVFNIVELFEKQFGYKPYVVNELQGSDSSDTSNRQYSGIAQKPETRYTDKGSLIEEKYRGIEIFLPIRLFVGIEELYLPYCVVSIGGKKSLIQTAMVERKGAVIEQYTIDNEQIDIKGFLLGENRLFPEKGIEALYNAYLSNKTITIDNALTNIFLSRQGMPADEQKRVMIADFKIIEVQGGRNHVRPFTMQLISDSIFKLELT